MASHTGETLDNIDENIHRHLNNSDVQKDEEARTKKEPKPFAENINIICMASVAKTSGETEQ